MRIIPFSEEWKAEWNIYVRKSLTSTFFHLIEWREIINKTFNYEPHYLIAEDSGKIVGILPLFLLRNIFAKKIFCSLPFAAYGGVDAVSDTAKHALIESAKQLVKQKNAQYLELRSVKESNPELLPKDLYVTFVKHLPADSGTCLEEIPRKARAAIRKGIESGLTIEFGHSLLKDFYKIYSTSLRNLGSPVFSFSFLKNILAKFEKESNISIVKYGRKSVAGVFTFLYKDTVMPYFAGSFPEYQKYQVNNFMYFKLMEFGIEHNYKFFDFGRSKKGTGAFKFKEFMGFESQQLYYSYYLHNTKGLPNLNPLNPKLQIFIKMWQKLPLIVANSIGPLLVKFTPP